MTTLEVQNLRCGYGLLEVVHGVTLAVRGGESVALLGRNGVGKTTTLLAVAGVRGSRVDGSRCRNVQCRLNKVAVVSQVSPMPQQQPFRIMER